jgi:GNAT superfamily N-acetyltransferase
MLRIQRYRDIIHRENLQITLAELGISEIPDFTEFEKSNLSYICMGRTGDIEGFILVKEIQKKDTPYEISFLGIMPRYRRKGYASRMIDMIKDKKQGICTTVLNLNKEASTLYQKLGFDKRPNGDYSVYVWGVNYNCYHCGLSLKPSETIWETLPYGLNISTYGLQQTMHIQSVCWNCRTKVES